MKFRFTIGLVLMAIAVQAQLLSWTPDFPGDASTVEVTLDANLGNQGLLNYNPDDVYVHTGVITNLSANPTQWKYVVSGNFNTPNASFKATSLGNNRWRFTITNVRAFYNVPGGETILKISILFKNGTGSRVQRNRDGSDMYIPIYPAGLHTRFTNPFSQPTYVPVLEPITNLFVGQPIPVTAKASQSSNMRILLNGTEVAAQNGVTSINANPTLASAGTQQIISEARVPASTPIYRFTGNGSWTTPANWQGSTVPPSVIPGGSEVIIDPSQGGVCSLDVSNTLVSFAAGSRLTVSDNARFVIDGNFSWPSASEFTGGFLTVRDTIEFFLAGPTPVENLPDGVAPNGVTYHNGGTAATVVLYAPNKQHIVILGDFNDWKPSVPYQMKRTVDGLRYWIRLEGLTPGTEYAYQFLIDGQLKLADYNTEKILDPWSDPQIPVQTYPNLKPYPTGKTTDIVSVLQPGKPAYNWTNNNFQRPDKRNIIAYELLIRDFESPGNFQTVINNLPELASLGINTLKLMPFTEFENNNSWGYNPSFMYAVDKAYGTENKLRELIDSCHGRGIAVVLDMVLNHQFGQSPMVRMYWDAATNKPAVNSPWFNADAKHPFNVGYDMNHEAPATIEFVENVMKHWLTKYRLDGFRWDLSKGFTQRNTPSDVGAWNAYDQSRVNIWQRIYNQSQSIAPGCYMILEHLGNDDEEAELAKRGMLLWGKMTSQFSEAAMGYPGVPDFNDSDPNNNYPGWAWDFKRAFHTTRWSQHGANNVPHLLAYGESHDEERLFYRNRRFGNESGSSVPPYFHNAKVVPDATIRMQQVAAFLFTIPGPKMLWQHGEFGYDASINMCENFTTPSGDGCRVDRKPLVTNMPVPYYSETLTNFTFSNYKSNNSRNSLRDMYARILKLRTRNPDFLPTYTTSSLAFDLAGAFKWQVIQSEALRMVVIGNFDVIQQSGTVNFPTTGNWQVYAHNIYGFALSNLSNINAGLTATTLTVNTNSQTFNNLPPGSFLVFLDRPASMATNMQSFQADLAAGSVQLNWQVEDEQHVAAYEIERSLDGVNYQVIGSKEVNRLPADFGVASHTFFDQSRSVVYGDSRAWYRIRIIDKKGEDLYSPAQIIEPEKPMALRYYPNFVQ